MKIAKLIILLNLFLIIPFNGHAQIKKIKFEQKNFTTEADTWWARSFADINGDGMDDIVLIHNNAKGGWLGWYETGENADHWTQHIIAGIPKTDEKFASGAMATGDFNNDGKTDILGFIHNGELSGDRGKPTEIYWFQNPGWERQYIGQAPAFVKDVVVADFNKDGLLDIAVNTHVKASVHIFSQGKPGWTEVFGQSITNVHEGMAAGDLDGDGYPDLAFNGYWLKSPGKNLSEEWKLGVIDEKWHTQTDDWTKNSTKVFCADINNDGKDEVFISQSERAGYPVAWYELKDAKNNTWEEHIINVTIAGCHTLQVFDFNNDGHLDVLVGENGHMNRDVDDPVVICLNNGDNVNFTNVVLSSGGIYNGIAGDVNGDGKIDFMRLSGHASKEMEIWINVTE